MTRPDAAGAVLWRRTDSVQIAVIHRPRYDDWSLPKGKLESGETAIVAARREVAEETGFDTRFGRRLRSIEYPASGQMKRVDFWAAEALDNDSAGKIFIPDDEVDELEWVSVDAAAEKLSYRGDRDVLADFCRLPADTHTTVLVRHAKAGTRGSFPGDDRLRPLDELGRTQAQALPANLLAFGVDAIHSAEPVRCLSTVAPLADLLGVEIAVEPALSESLDSGAPSAAYDRLRAITALPGIRAVCSQGKVIPGLMTRLAQRDGVTLPPAGNRKASFWVLSTYNGRLVAADWVESPLA